MASAEDKSKAVASLLTEASFMKAAADRVIAEAPCAPPPAAEAVAARGSQTGADVWLGPRMNKSLQVQGLPTLRWKKNDRGLHTETNCTYPSGWHVKLGCRGEGRNPKTGKAWVWYELPGVIRNDGFSPCAHVTVYDGPDGPHVADY